MGKFNLNQILSDTSKQAAAGGGVTAPHPTESHIEKLSVYDLVPSEDNFYSMREIEELKTAIQLAGKVLQNLVVVPLDGGKYKVIAGHRRRLASIALVEEGNPQYEFVPCDVEPTEEEAEEQEVRDGFMLIATNSQREKTAWDRIEEVRYLRDVLEKARTKPRFVAMLQKIVATVFGGGDVQFDGTRDFIARTLHTSPAQIGRYDAIIRNLCPEFMKELKEDRINVSTAYELSGLSTEDQQAAFTEYQKSGAISIREARAKKPDAEPQAVTQNTAPPSPAQPEPIKQAAAEPRKPPAENKPNHPAETQRPVPSEKPPTAEPERESRNMKPKVPEETRCVDGGICPYCKERFDAAEAVNYSTLGTQTVGPAPCPHCGKPIKIFCSVEYFCSAAEE